MRRLERGYWLAVIWLAGFAHGESAAILRRAHRRLRALERRP